jgi:choline kinase
VRAIILAAGLGLRLRPGTRATPKCLLRVGGRPLLDRMLEALAAVGVREATLVVGHQQRRVIAAARAQASGVAVECVANPAYATRGSIVSLWCARGRLDGPILFLDGDLLFARRLLQGFVQGPPRSALLVDPALTDTGEEVKVVSRDGRAVALTKRPEPGVAGDLAEWTGILRLTASDARLLAEVLDDLVRRGRTEAAYEEALQVLVRKREVRVEPVGGLPWVEIDFPHDLARAERDILAALRALGEA